MGEEYTMAEHQAMNVQCFGKEGLSVSIYWKK